MKLGLLAISVLACLTSCEEGYGPLVDQSAFVSAQLAMMGPDYTHWHGVYEVAKHWYTQFIPELKELAEKNLHSTEAAKVEGAKKLEAALGSI